MKYYWILLKLFFFFFKYNHLAISSGVQLPWDYVFAVIMMFVTLMQKL